MSRNIRGGYFSKFSAKVKPKLLLLIKMKAVLNIILWLWFEVLTVYGAKRLTP